MQQGQADDLASIAGKWVTLQAPDERTDGQAAIAFTYHTGLVQHIKLLPHRTWSQGEKVWLVPAEHIQATILHFRQAGVRVKLEVDPGLVKQKLDMVPNLCEADRDSRLANIPVEIIDRLFAYQRLGVQFGVQRMGRLLIADEPGLGKTVQAILIAAAFSDRWPLLIVCPSGLRNVWDQHLREWLPEDLLQQTRIQKIMLGKDIQFAVGLGISPRQVTIVSYDLVPKVPEAFCRAHQFIICDECHMLKNPQALRTMVMKPLLQKAKHAVLISGTPLQAKPIQIFPLIDMLRPGLLGSRDEFGQRYCGGLKRQIGGRGFADYVGASNMKELNEILQQTIMIRRLKQDVLTDLPDKLRTSIPVAVSIDSQMELEALNGQLNALKSDTRLSEQEIQNESRQLIGKLYRATGRAKLEGSIQHLLTLLDAGERSHKVIVFGHHTCILDSLEAAVKAAGCGYGWVRIDGSTSPAKKSEAVERFQRDKSVQVALLSITAAGTGLTLTEASVVMFAELTWSPGDLVQAEDRAHRVGQTKALQVHYMVATAQASADGMMWVNLRNKLKIVGKIVDGHLKGTAAGLKLSASQQAPSTPEARQTQPMGSPYTPISSQPLQSQNPNGEPPQLPRKSIFARYACNPRSSSSPPEDAAGRGMADSQDQDRSVRRKLFEGAGPRSSNQEYQGTAVVDLTQPDDDEDSLTLRQKLDFQAAHKAKRHSEPDSEAIIDLC